MKALVLSWEETRGQLAPAHHGTALELLSTDSPGAVTRVLCLRPPPRSDAFARRFRRCSGLIGVTFRCRFLQLHHVGTRVWTFAAFETFPSCLPFGVFLVIPEGFHGVFVHRLNGTFIINVNHYRKCWNAYVCTNPHHNQPLFVEFCTNPDGRFSVWKCCQSSVGCSISRPCCWFNCVAVQITTGILEKLSEAKKFVPTFRRLLWR